MADGRMRIGIVLPIAQEEADGLVAPYTTLRAIAVATEDAGFDSVWVFDHLRGGRHAVPWRLTC